MTTTTPGPRRTRPATGSLVATVAALAGWCAFAWYLLAQARAGPAIIWNDSRAYAAVASKPLWSSGFWAGQRPPLTPLLIKAFGTSSGLVTAQAVIAAVAWGILAWTVGRVVAPGWRRVVAIWVMLGFATTLPITMWNRSVLSESLAMSLLALVVAGSIWTVRRSTWPRIGATSAACLGFAATRDTQVWTVGLLAAAVCVYALTLLRRDHQEAVRAGVLGVCLLVIVLLTEWGTLSSDRTTQDTAHVFAVRVFPYPDRVAWFAAHGMPQQIRIDQLARATPAPAHAAKAVTFDRNDPAFGPLEHWLVTKGTETYLRWVVVHPWYVVSEPLRRPERSYNFAQGDLTFYAAATNRMESPLTLVMWPPLVEFSLISALAVYLAVLSGVWRERAWRLVVVLAGIGVVAILIAWHGDGQEVTRHTVEGLAEVRLGVWILVVWGMLGMAESGGGGRAIEDPVAETAPPIPGGTPTVSPEARDGQEPTGLPVEAST
jgi:hypothetical protein